MRYAFATLRKTIRRILSYSPLDRVEVVVNGKPVIKLIAQVNSRGRFQNPDQRKEVIDLFRRAQDVYRQLQRQARTAD